jgi:hypothetical protein
LQGSLSCEKNGAAHGTQTSSITRRTTLIPLQEVDVHTSKNVFYKAQIIRPTGSSSFYAEVVLHDSEFQPPFSSSVTFRRQFQDEKAAYEQVISWVKGHTEKYGYPIDRINNPCNCEFIEIEDQKAIIGKLGLNVPVQKNGANPSTITDAAR